MILKTQDNFDRFKRFQLYTLMFEITHFGSYIVISCFSYYDHTKFNIFKNSSLCIGPSTLRDILSLSLIGQ